MLAGLGAAVLAGLLAWRTPKVAVRTMAAAVVILMLAAPVAARLIPDPQQIWANWRPVGQSVQHRLFIWGFTAKRIAERPVFGWGMNGAKAIPGGTDDVVVGSREDEMRWRPMPLHPHNAVLQWWLELGAVGALLATALSLRLIIAIERISEPATRSAVLAAGTNFVVVSLVSFGAWQSWWLASLVVVCWLTSLAVGGPAGASCVRQEPPSEPSP